jgi:hypothetical protein
MEEGSMNSSPPMRILKVLVPARLKELAEDG